MKNRELTMGQAIVQFLMQQYVERDGIERAFFAGMFGIFGHGNVAGIGQALHQYSDAFRFYQTRNEQSMVHTAAAYAKMSNRLSTFACTTSIGPGATNMLTGAAGATINRLPVLLLPGDIFSTRLVAPVLQQLESPDSQDFLVNDCFKPVSRYWDRINRPEQIITALPEAMRVLTSQAETGTVTLALPQDVQAEGFHYPEQLFEKRIYTIPRPRADANLLNRAVQWISNSERPLIIAGGGVIYSEATEQLAKFAEQTGIPVGETFAGKGSLRYDHPQNLGAIGATGTPGANIAAREADLVIAIGTRLSDFTTASKTAFQNPNVRFIAINIAEFDAAKHAALPLVADARVTLSELSNAIGTYRINTDYATQIENYRDAWEEEVERLFHLDHQPLPSQSEVIGVVNEFSRPEDVVVCAAGSLPGDLHKLWRTRNPKQLVGDGSYLMLAQEIITSIQENYKLIIVLINNDGHSSIGGLSQATGVQGFATRFRYRDDDTGELKGDILPVDLAANAKSLGANVIEATTTQSLKAALQEARENDRTTVVKIDVDFDVRVPQYESWWDVPVAEVSEVDSAKQAYQEYKEAKQKERYFLG